MSRRLNEKREVTPEHAIKFLEQFGTKINFEEAEIILDFMYKMSKLTLENYIKSKVKQGSSTPK